MRSGRKDITVDLGEANPKQLLFFQARAPFVAYGGAKGGGKTWAVQRKAVWGACNNAGIRILIMRSTYPELDENHIQPLLRLVPKELAKYNKTERRMTFWNGSTIKFGHWTGVDSEREYQGQEFDWIFLDEATQFSERTFDYLGGCLRGITQWPKRMYLTCNPGGIGHAWVKRLFIDRDYIHDPENPEKNENPDDYVFIPALVEDNPKMLEASPRYLQMLSSMPEDQYKAFRYGDWDALSGVYFSEFRRDKHTCAPFEPPKHWQRFRAFDYGLDMLACLWIAVDESGRSWVYREYCQSGLVVSEAAERILKLSEGERITATYAPPDMWNRQKDTGRTMAEIYAGCGIGLIKASNDRVAGHMLIKDALREANGGPQLKIFSSCKELIRCMGLILRDDINPSDCAKIPHDITHIIDALRYFTIMRHSPSELPMAYEDWGDEPENYDDYMTGGSAGADYILGGAYDSY
ncbi:MAG: phage terminase large subunit [Oscillospiraceae bacterium]|nr:phage terminase large subunit [Oscillospiraceae bacterium]